jgi:N-acetylmuramoyl-L-alanine amidase
VSANVSRFLVLAAAAVLALPAQGRTPSVAIGQERRLASAQAAFEKLSRDAKRRRFRDPWVAVIRELEAVVRLDPSGPRAAEARLAAARAREELWRASRSKADGASAVDAYRKVDEKAPGTTTAAQALAAAASLARALGSKAEVDSICKRITARYAAATVPSCAVAPPKADPKVTPTSAAAAPSGKPVDADADEEAPDALQALAETTRSEAEEAQALHEPDAPEAPPASTVTSADADGDEEEARPEAAETARHIRKTLLAKTSVPLSAQLGMKARRVVIDAGHGGKDTGALGKRGVREKDVSLAIAKRLEKRLRALGFEVVQTRTDDRYVSLDDRARIANEAKGDLFLSIHCNSARRRNLGGIETWTLNVAANRYAARLSAFENAGSAARLSDLRLILADLAKKADTTEARELARSVQAQLVRTVRARVGPVRDHGVKQALFYVLLGTKMPSILVETAFLSNADEEKRLKSARYQEATAEAIARGVKDYLDGRKRLARAGVP